MISDKFITRYLSFAAGYTLIHKLPKIWNGKIESEKYNENYKQVVYNRSLLIGEKVSIMGMSMIYSPLLAIPWMLDDISRMEIYFKNLTRQNMDLIINIKIYWIIYTVKFLIVIHLITTSCVLHALH